MIEEALRRHLGLDLLETMWAKASMTEGEADELAAEAQHRTRPSRPR